MTSSAVFQFEKMLKILENDKKINVFDFCLNGFNSCLINVVF